MRFKDVFAIIGPAMVGPSSSHTAGAARLGRAARMLHERQPQVAVITLYGSFAETYRGHGTDVALVGGLLGYDTDDPRIPIAMTEAERAGMQVTFRESAEHMPHPNTVKLELRSGGSETVVIGASIGGGNIEVGYVDGFDVRFSGVYPTLVLTHEDRTGFLAVVTTLLAALQINIGYMIVDRKGRKGEAMTVIETDSPLAAEGLASLAALPGVQRVRTVDLTAEDDASSASPQSAAEGHAATAGDTADGTGTADIQGGRP
ncbi:L-serine ammonia-lyase, iron-sulfur-dependent subunit beta [Gordoniibacillus kamchatkensis]|uniref:L-serine ammonia-lyase, iron-sulfur-dependent subunit beta n=1 Tax=Gordoniibacillus kamchatkensis TaxID=1590651 RepID=UPI0009E37680|nr:L-serine ammonia-lyase, iron-sulfur-dependent subunit beta [Paenibacillus sp. VKM B-2647]